MMNKWMQAVASKMKAKGTVGALHKEMGVAAGEKIPTSAIKSAKAALSKKAAGSKKLSKADLQKMHRLQFAANARNKK